MNSQKTYAVNAAKAIAETIDGETIIINLATGTYYSLNPAATELWSAIESARPIIACEKSVSDFLDFLSSEELIEMSPESSGEAFASTGTPACEAYRDMQDMLLADPIHDVDNAGWPNIKQD